MRIAYADPPYPGQAHLYADHPDYAGEVDHEELVEQLECYDGWVLHTSSSALRYVLGLCPADTRVMAWVKTFASFKPGVRPAYAWEPVLMRPARKAKIVRSGSRHDSNGSGIVMADFIICPIELRKGLVGAKPAPVCRWAFDCVGAEPTDELADLFPGTGAVARAWQAWASQLRLELA
jgi:hypothetical protein